MINRISFTNRFCNMPFYNTQHSKIKFGQQNDSYIPSVARSNISTTTENNYLDYTLPYKIDIPDDIEVNMPNGTVLN